MQQFCCSVLFFVVGFRAGVDGSRLSLTAWNHRQFFMQNDTHAVAGLKPYGMLNYLHLVSDCRCHHSYSTSIRLHNDCFWLLGSRYKHCYPETEVTIEFCFACEKRAALWVTFKEVIAIKCLSQQQGTSSLTSPYHGLLFKNDCRCLVALVFATLFQIPNVHLSRGLGKIIR